MKKCLIARPVVPLGKDIGYLPGDVHEKLYNWMLPVYDNMEFIVHATAMEEHLEELSGGEPNMNKYGKHKEASRANISIVKKNERGKGRIAIT